MKVLEENINMKIIHLSAQKNTKFSTIVTEVYFTLFEKLKLFLFQSDYNMKEIFNTNLYHKKTHELVEEGLVNENSNPLIEFYEQNSSTANTIFNERFNKNALQNLSNLLIDLFDLFEIYLDKDTLEALNESKTVTIEKIFMAFLNEKIINNLNLANEENTINYFDTHLSVFNFSAFSFTKSFLKNLFKSYKNTIEFYINILTKTKDVYLSHEVIYDSLVLVLKSFMLKFHDFYHIEAEGPEDFNRLNCLIIEIVKNFNYLKLEIKTILKNLFKNKESEYEPKIENLYEFIERLKENFLDKYLKNSAKILINLFTPWNFINSNCKNYSGYNNYNSGFYEKYNELLLNDCCKNANKENYSVSTFNDIRSCLIDMILNLSESIKIFFRLEEENSSPIKTKKNNHDKLRSTINEIIYNFYEMLYDSIQAKSSNSILNEAASNIKLISQIFIEVEFFNSIVENFLNSATEELLINIKKILIKKMMKLKLLEESSNADESVVFSKEELERKNKILSQYANKYAAYFKCFKI